MSSLACSTEARWELMLIILKIAPMTINRTATTITNSTTEKPRIRLRMILVSHHHPQVYRAGEKQIPETAVLQLGAHGDHVSSCLGPHQGHVPAHVINGLFNSGRGAWRFHHVIHVVVGWRTCL